MHADVDQRATALPRLLGERDPPGDAAPAQRMRPRGVDVAELASIDEPLECLGFCTVAVLKAEAQEGPRHASGDRHPLRLRHRRRRGLLAQHMAAGSHRSDGRVCVVAVGDAHADGIEIGVGEHVGIAAVRTRDSEHPGTLLGAVSANVGDRYYLSARGAFRICRYVPLRGDLTTADHADLQGTVHRFSRGHRSNPVRPEGAASRVPGRNRIS